MILKNGTVLTDTWQFVQTDLVIEDGVIAAVGPTALPGTELRGAYVLPGLVDVHTHGFAGADHNDADPAATVKIRRALADRGTTSILATVMTARRETMERAVENAAASGASEGAAHIRGIYLEGPFFSERYKGAQPSAHLSDPDPGWIGKLQTAAGGKLRVVSLAPERPGAVELIRSAGEIRIFLGHTDADYETARAAIDAGARGLTHTFNAMRGLHHRSPQALGAALTAQSVYCECICDGFHVHPAMVELLYRTVGRERFLMISDSIPTAGLPDGEYPWGGRTVRVQGGRSYLADGTIAGSTTFLLEEVRNLVSWGVASLSDAVYAASAVPAMAVGLYDRIGSITPGKSADLLILSHDLQLESVLLGAE